MATVRQSAVAPDSSGALISFLMRRSTTSSVRATFILLHKTNLSAACDWLNWLSWNPIDQSQAADYLVRCSSRKFAKSLDVAQVFNKIINQVADSRQRSSTLVLYFCEKYPDCADQLPVTIVFFTFHFQFNYKIINKRYPGLDWAPSPAAGHCKTRDISHIGNW